MIMMMKIMIMKIIITMYNDAAAADKNHNLNNISEKSFRPPAGAVTYSADLQSKNYLFHLKIVEFL